MLHPIIVVTLDGFSPAALGCYGCSWNQTPSIDRIASAGVVWDRCLSSSDDPVASFRALADSLLASITKPEADASRGAVELITDSSSVAQAARNCQFHQIDLVATEPVNVEAEVPLEIADTQLARLVATAIERHAENPDWSVIWLHSQFLTHRWDAPRGDWATESEVDEMEPESADIVAADRANEAERQHHDGPPSVFHELTPPSIELTGGEHPDFVIAWMRTYACQIQLLDFLMETIVGIAGERQASLLVAGTSGFRLGQGDAIGHRPRQLRSRDIHVPMIYCSGGPIRYPSLISYNHAGQMIAALSQGENGSATPTTDQSPMMVTESPRAERAVTTDDWFMVVDLDGTDHLYSKPDDIEDFNDVARVRPDVIAMLESAQENPASS